MLALATVFFATGAVAIMYNGCLSMFDGSTETGVSLGMIVTGAGVDLLAMLCQWCVGGEAKYFDVRSASDISQM